MKKITTPVERVQRREAKTMALALVDFLNP
jgi:hypothetical protein